MRHTRLHTRARSNFARNTCTILRAIVSRCMCSRACVCVRVGRIRASVYIQLERFLHSSYAVPRPPPSLTTPERQRQCLHYTIEHYQFGLRKHTHTHTRYVEISFAVIQLRGGRFLLRAIIARIVLCDYLRMYRRQSTTERLQSRTHMQSSDTHSHTHTHSVARTHSCTEKPT